MAATALYSDRSVSFQQSIPFDHQFATALNAATLTFLRHGDLSQMAANLLLAAQELLDTEGGLIFDLDSESHPRLLACNKGDWGRSLTPDPQTSETWLTGFPQKFWSLPLDRGEPLLLNEEDLDHQQLRNHFPESIRSLFALPLEAEGVGIGALFLFNRKGSFNTASCLETESMGHSIALAIAAARARIAQQQVETELRQAQKMEALGQLAAGVAHDFNNMLTVINGYVSLVSRQLPDEDPQQPDLATVLEAGQRAADLSRQLLAFSRRQMLQPQVLDLNERIDNLQKMLRRVIREDISFILELEQPLPYIKADTGQLEQILMNLAINARDAMPTGGTLTIRTGETEFGADFIRANPGSQPGQYVWFSISDTGTGILPADQAKIFQPFFTTKEKGKGTGLGLATVYGIVKQSGGYITVTSESGAGTQFTVYLPRTNEGPQVEGTAPLNQPSVNSANFFWLRTIRKFSILPPKLC